jgi:hypothetical protein
MLTAITRKQLTISGLTGVNKIANGNNVATLSGTAIVNGIIGTEKVTLSGTPVAVFEDTTVGIDRMISVTGYTLEGDSIVLANYSLEQPTGLTGNITAPLPVHLKAFKASVSKKELATTRDLQGRSVTEVQDTRSSRFRVSR